MAYLGQGPFQEFTNPPTKDSFTGDGSTVAFDMASEVPSGSQNALEVFVDNVRQEPGTGKAFTLGVDGSGDHKRITFSAAPANGASIYVINDKTNSTIVAPLSNDLNGTELILDVDGDTSITADTDDRIDFKIANVEHFSFSNSSGDTVIKPMVDAKDILFQQYDGRTLLDINDGGYIAIANGATGPGQLRLYEDTDNGTNFTALQVGTQSGDITYTLPTADGSSNDKLTTNGSGTLSWVATNVPTSADGQALGSASAEWSDLFLADGSIIKFGNDQDVTLTHVADTGLLLNSTMQLQFNDSSQYINAPSNAILDINATDEIELNATLVDVNANLDVSGTIVSGGTLTATTSIGIGSAVLTEAELELLDGLTAGTAIASKVVTTDANIDSTGMRNLTITGELDAATLDISGNADIDGTLEADAITINGTAIAAAGTSSVVTVGALDSGSITSGFGNIDNGASNITSGGLVKLDVDADADDVSGDSATGRLTLGAGEDLNLYHGGTNSYIVNDTGDLILKTGASDEDMIFQGNDGGAAITALTLDMSAAGAAAFNSTVTATGFIIGSANIAESELEMLDGITAGTVIASKALVADANIDITGGRNITISGELDAATLDISGNADIDGTTNLDAVDIDGAVQIDGATTFGVDDTGVDVKFFGATSGAYLLWDESADKLLTAGGTTIDIIKDKLLIGGTAVTTTAAELNKLDGAGTLAQAGKHTIWVPAQAMTPTASNGCAAIATVETTSGRPDMNVLDFDKDSDEFAQFSVAFPKSWDAGTITFQFFWSGLAATTGVAMNLQGVSFADNDSIDTAYGTAVVVQDDAQGAVEELLVSAESGAVTIAGSPGDNELCYFRVGRDVSDGNDDMAGDCRLHGIKLFFTTDAANDA